MPLMSSQRLKNGTPLLLIAIAAVLLINAAQAQDNAEAGTASGAGNSVQASVFGHLSMSTSSLTLMELSLE